MIESKTPIISGQVVELGSRTKQSEVSLQKVCNIRLDTGWKQNNGPEKVPPCTVKQSGKIKYHSAPKNKNSVYQKNLELAGFELGTSIFTLYSLTKVLLSKMFKMQ